ncbi:hypothetical protein [Nostoc sphaeroides]|uniref:hypothetical protein n=1 Tax=Nostoc sphaeroides TaxID=446679 RepID=UPI001269AB36|nr:hypothetical protein [Nostoc sphaeroides]
MVDYPSTNPILPKVVLEKRGFQPNFSIIKRSHQTKTNPEVTPVNPEVTSVNPEVTSVNPEVTSVNPELTSVNPEVTTANPEATTANSASNLKKWHQRAIA